MKRRLCVLAIILISALSVYETAADSQKKTSSGQHKAGTISEEKAATNATADAPPECAQVVRDFIAYISRPKPDIATDKQAQSRWLSDDLRKGLEHRLAAYNDYAKKNADSPEEPPSNADFVGSWDYPTTYSIVGVRRYDKRAIVDVTLKWGPKTQYPGDSRLASYVVVRERDAWKLDDVYTFRGEFVSTGSLSQTFASATYP
jgi:hypothetical protein